MDPLPFVFGPAAATVLGLVAAPIVYLRHLLWRRAARRLNAEARCGRCGARLGIDAMFLYGGAYVCRECATRLQRRLARVLPIAVVGAAALALTSLAAATISINTGGTTLAWWLGGTLIPLALPSVGLAVATLAAIRSGRRLNRLRDASDLAQLENPDVTRPPGA